jgi:hypothetical protein
MLALLIPLSIWWLLVVAVEAALTKHLLAVVVERAVY